MLPQEGVKCWASISKGKFPAQGFTNSFEELVTTVLDLSARGEEAYFACASFKDASSRKQKNALGAKAFWLDLDCGPKKDYASADVALVALDEFANQLKLPLPVVVRSGRGIHAYWPLSHTIPADEWIPTAKLFKQATERLGLHADPARTADIASILRPPGTFNFKYDPPLAVILEDADHELISLSQMHSAVTQIEPARAYSFGAAASNILASKPSSVSPTDGVQEGGRNNACARLVGILLAQGHGAEDIWKQVNAWNQTNKPPLTDEEVRQVIASISRAEAEKPPRAPITIPLENPIPAPLIPPGYTLFNGAMMAAHEDDEGNPKAALMCSFECYLVDVCRMEGANIESYVFAAFHPHNGWHSFIISRENFDGSAWLSHMGANCTNIVNPRLYKIYVSYAAVLYKERKMDSVRYSQFGWKDEKQSFLVGNALIKRNGVVEYAYGDDKLDPRMRGMKVPKQGSRSAWTLAANKFFAPGFEAQGFGLLTSFGSVLMAFVSGATDGGAWLALHSQGSGYGKTNTLQAIASVWGAYDALAVSGADTENAKFNIISTARHLPVYEEEMGKNDPIKEAAIIKRYVGGTEKNRSARDGSVEFKDKRFQNIMISASNHSLADILRMSGDQGAMARVFEIPMEVPTDKEAFKEFSRLGKIMLDNCAYAGREFIFNLLQPGVLEWAEKALEAAVVQYMKLLETTPKDRYVVYMLACNLIAGKLLNTLGILSFDENRIMQWAVVQARVRVENPDADSPVEVLNQFISEAIMDCLVVDGPFHSKKPSVVLRYPHKNIVMRFERDTGRLFISQHVLRAWFSKNHAHLATTAKLLEKEKILVTRAKQVTLAAGTDYPSVRTLAWEIDMGHPAVNGGLQLIAQEISKEEKAKSLSF